MTKDNCACVCLFVLSIWYDRRWKSEARTKRKKCSARSPVCLFSHWINEGRSNVSLIMYVAFSARSFPLFDGKSLIDHYHKRKLRTCPIKTFILILTKLSSQHIFFLLNICPLERWQDIKSAFILRNLIKLLFRADWVVRALNILIHDTTS